VKLRREQYGSVVSSALDIRETIPITFSRNCKYLLSLILADNQFYMSVRHAMFSQGDKSSLRLALAENTSFIVTWILRIRYLKKLSFWLVNANILA